jgi:hypothetical protein
MASAPQFDPSETPDHGARPASKVGPPPAVAAKLEPEPSWARYDQPLERLCRIAAAVGGAQAAPLSYTALVIGFLWGDDPVSRWFQEYVDAHRIDAFEIFRSKNLFGNVQDFLQDKTTQAVRRSYVSIADSGRLPNAEPLYSTSARRVLTAAAQIAREGRCGRHGRNVPRHGGVRIQEPERPSRPGPRLGIRRAKLEGRVPGVRRTHVSA